MNKIHNFKDNQPQIDAFPISAMTPMTSKAKKISFVLGFNMFCCLYWKAIKNYLQITATDN